MTARRLFTIVWDFDGTLLPLQPWDSEQELLLARLAGLPAASWKRWYGRCAVEADRRGWRPAAFKRRYLAVLRGAPRELLELVAARLAERIPAADRAAVRELAARGHRQLVASCGTADLSERILEGCGLRSCFEAVHSNRFLFAEGRIAGLRLEVGSGRAKLELVRGLGVDRAGAVAVAVGQGGRRAAGRLPCRFAASSAGVLEVVRSLGG